MGSTRRTLLDAHRFRSIADVTADEWRDGLGLAPDELPDAVIVEGSWWRAERQAWRLGHLDDVRELGFPDIYWGRRKGRNVVFSMAYGSARTIEVVYMAGALGAKLAVQIGTCGGLQSHLEAGDVIVPESVVGRDGVAQLFGDTEIAFADPELVAAAEALLRRREHTTHRGAHVTFSSLFAETPAMMAGWNQAGLLSVDMETATTLSVASHFGMAGLSLLVVWDDLTRGKRFLDPMTDAETAALDRANGSVYDVALELVERL